MQKYKLYHLKTSALLTGTATILALSGCGGKDYPELSEPVMHAEDINQTEDNSVFIGFSDITNDDLKEIPSNTVKLNIQHCYYLTSLDSIPEICPNLEELTVGNCPSIIDLSFIYQLPNLKKVTFYECVGIDYDLLNYLNDHEIENNITNDDIKVNMVIDGIIKQTINDEMTDEEKIKAITLYIINNFEYDEEAVFNSNVYPLTTMIQNKKGVCAGYAYLNNVLLRKANINSNYIIDNDHAWNLVEQDEKYYYLDTTNVDDFFPRKTIEAFNIAPYYMTDPNNTLLTSMTPYDMDNNTVIIPKSFIEDIKRGEDKKSLIEKYRGDAVSYWFTILGIPNIIALSFFAHQMKLYLKERKKDKEEQEKTRSI